MKKIWISYNDENDEKREGFFRLIQETKNYIKILSSKNNILTIPFHRINKIKEESKLMKGGNN